MSGAAQLMSTSHQTNGRRDIQTDRHHTMAIPRHAFTMAR